MIKKLEPLTKDNHQDLRFSSTNNFGFAEKVSTAPLAFSEITVASKYYPIVFLKNAELPSVILSLEQEKNGFLTPEGKWKVPYVPAHFRTYPFMLAKTAKTPPEQNTPPEQAAQPSDAGAGDPPSNEAPSTDQKFILCIDRDAPHFATAQGDLMFTANGEFTELVTKRLDFLKVYQGELNTTANLVRLMDEKEILVDRRFLLNVDGRSVPVGGFRTVDTQRLNALDDALLADWVRKGIISLITAHLNSLADLPMAE